MLSYLHLVAIFLGGVSFIHSIGLSIHTLRPMLRKLRSVRRMVDILNCLYACNGTRWVGIESGLAGGRGAEFGSEA